MVRPGFHRFSVLLAAGVLALAACVERVPHSERVTPTGPTVVSAPPAEAIVRADPGGMLLRDRRWWPAGFNAPQLATNYAVNFGCGAEVDLDAFFGKLPPHAMTRFSLFQALAVNKNTGKLDFTAADAVFTAAERHGQVLLPVLAPQNGDCDDEVFKQRAWYADGWKRFTASKGRAVMSLHDWVTAAVRRWRSSPILAGWELVGEPETSVCDRGRCELRYRTCPRDAAQVLRAFMDQAGTLVRELDPRRPIFAGFIGGSQCGTAGDSFAFVSASPQIDVLEYHDYNEDRDPLPGGPTNGLARRLQQAARLGKPLLVAEIGEYAGSCDDLTARRDVLAARLDGQRAAGTAGGLIWAFVPDPRPDECTYDVGPGDPLWGLVARLITLG
ncbi:beta-mannosidase [Nocardia terpenica]|uniref:Beta-mannosidase n=1 Tax=Nocardia terpenica TaxID=455432 RepID=A0A291RI26_9NOCA|nr:beta-mannosidase [Nocardia terpenica]ATL66980.1 beta-mannosidase [Nocardia terpenica]